MPLKQKEKELRTVLDNISDGILFIDNKGTIKVYNRALLKMLSLNEDLTGIQIFSLPLQHPVRQGIFRADRGFSGPYCWQRHQCPSDIDCDSRGLQGCRCWVFSSTCGSLSLTQDKSCIKCQQYQNVKCFLEKPKELEIGDKTLSVLSSFIEFSEKDEIWEIIVFKDVTLEKLDAAIKLANATAHELRQPLQAIVSSIALLRGALGDEPKIKESFDIIEKSCYRMNSIIRNIGHITRYKTKHYLLNQRILDIEESSESIERDSRSSNDE